MAAVSMPILDADFLCAFRLLVDVTNYCLIDAVSFAICPCTCGGICGLCLSNTLATADQNLQLPAEFPVLTTPTFSSTVAIHNVEHHTHTHNVALQSTLVLGLSDCHANGDED